MQMWAVFAQSPLFLFSLLGLALLFVILTGILFFQVRELRKRQAVLFSGKEARDLETLLIEQRQEIIHLDKEIQELFEISNSLHRLASSSLHKVAVLRFNPFKDTGGNQSFSVALLDGKNNGAVISSLHTKEGTRVYAKPIKAGEAEGFPLTEEEKEALIKAQQK